MHDDDVAPDQPIAAGHPLSSDRPMVDHELQVEPRDERACIAVALRGLADVAQVPPEREVAVLDGVLQRRPVHDLRDDVGERGVPLELREPEGGSERADDGIGEVGEDVLSVVELHACEVARVAADIRDDETGGFGSVGHRRSSP